MFIEGQHYCFILLFMTPSSLTSKICGIVPFLALYLKDALALLRSFFTDRIIPYIHVFPSNLLFSCPLFYHHIRSR